ncbi:MAG: hypothetical protein P4L85_04805 [Paludisphaera borealis]|uniref:hypothetical protein n=1 Tax=Paludisphaera borealis TaxID=1387353 RepID=UPI00283F90EC|nr:hypothetical protein [Paludisphaera borealis]MDR3618650.1 hypothetical protein [Paludisphaera borealis]
MSFTRRSGKTSVVVATLLLVCGSSPADDKPAAPEKISGLIVNVDKYLASGQTAAGAAAERWVVTISTDVLWRDFVRDQAVSPEQAAKNSTTRAASKGRKSVASEGQPLDSALIATADLDSQTKLAMRYRSSTDEATLGATTPEGAAKAEAAVDSGDTSKPAPASRTAAKPRAITTKDLKPGLWVEIEMRPGDSKHAQTLTVLQPVEDVKVPTESVKPASPSK